MLKNATNRVVLVLVIVPRTWRRVFWKRNRLSCDVVALRVELKGLNDARDCSAGAGADIDASDRREHSSAAKVEASHLVLPARASGVQANGELVLLRSARLHAAQ